MPFFPKRKRVIRRRKPQAKSYVKRKGVRRGKRKSKFGLSNKMVMPMKLYEKFRTQVKFYIPSGGASVGYFDVALNDLHQPWAQTVAFDTAPRVASLSTASSALTGFEGLSNFLSGLAGSKFYQQYRVFGTRAKVQIISQSSADCGVCVVTPWKAGDLINTTISTADTSGGSVTSTFKADKTMTISKYYSVASLWGVPKIAISLEDKFQAIGGAVPTNSCYLRIFYGRGDGAVLTTGLEFSVELTCFTCLSNAVQGGQVSTVV